MGIFDILKRQDLFGSQVLLSFKHEGNTINTNCGGFVSLLIKLLLLYIFLIRIQNNTTSYATTK